MRSKSLLSNPLDCIIFLNYNQAVMRKLFFVCLFAALLSTAVFANVYLQDNFNSKIRLINDHAEQGIYYLRGMWYPLNKVPYHDTFSEYPQAATYLFGLPHAILMGEGQSNYSEKKYYLIFAAIMMAFLALTIALLFSMRDKNKYLALLMLLPASLYFSYNRFDIFPVFLGILSIKLLSKERYGLAAFTLALGVLAKWYLVVIFPVMLSFYYNKHWSN